MILSNQGIYEGVLTAGLRLAEISEKQGGWREFFESDDGSMDIQDPVLKAQTVILLENTKRELAKQLPRRNTPNGLVVLDETTRSSLVGGFSDFLFPIIRAGFPSNPINELISVQPTTRRTAQIVYWDWIVGTSKGIYQKGFELFGANTGKQTRDIHFSDEVIDREAIPALGGANATDSGTLAFHDGGGIRPGTVAITLATTGSGTVVFADNGNGAFVGAGVTIGSSSINYQTGAWSITLGAAETFTTAATNTATYSWDSEGSQSIPQVDVRITTNTVQTRRRAMKLNYSREAVQDVVAEFGIQLEPSLVGGCAEQMNYEIARQIIAEIWAVAPVAATFDLKVPSGISQQEHFRDLLYQLNIASNNIWARTQKGYGNWIIVDEGAANLVESLPASMFVAAPRPAKPHGLHFIGTLNNKFRVYKDLHLDKEPGSSAVGNLLMGYKGTDFFDAGFVWSPYQLLYTTNALETADFITQRGMASRYATKLVNANMYARINLAST